MDNSDYNTKNSQSQKLIWGYIVLAIVVLLRAAAKGESILDILQAVLLATICSLGVAPALVLVCLSPFAFIIGHLLSRFFLKTPLEKNEASSLKMEVIKFINQDQKYLRLIMKYIKQSREAGRSDEQISSDLALGGWDKPIVDEAFKLSDMK